MCSVCFLNVLLDGDASIVQNFSPFIRHSSCPVVSQKVAKTLLKVLGWCYCMSFLLSTAFFRKGSVISVNSCTLESANVTQTGINNVFVWEGQFEESEGFSDTNTAQQFLILITAATIYHREVNSGNTGLMFLSNLPRMSVLWLCSGKRRSALLSFSGSRAVYMRLCQNPNQCFCSW